MLEAVKEKDNGKKRVINIRLSEAEIKKLDEIAGSRYRGVSRSKAVSLLLEDAEKG